jgi:hypothetical protein
MKFADLRTDAGIQVRTRIHEETVSDYAEAMKAGAQFPQIVVFHDGSDCFVGDGFQRIPTAARIGRKETAAEIRKGTAIDAPWFALGTNKRNGLRMTADDRKYAILPALKIWPDRNQNAIAEQIGTSRSCVEKLKKDDDSESE